MYVPVCMLSIECNKGMYGPGCHETCGYCRDINQCCKTNGTCLTGCAVGYQGYLCKTGEFAYQGSLFIY